MLKSTFGKTNAFILKWFGLFGLPFYVFFNKAATDAIAVDADADIFDIAGEFYGSITNATLDSFIPGTLIVLRETFNLVVDTILPGVGTTLSLAFNAAADSAELTQFAPDLSPSI